MLCDEPEQCIDLMVHRVRVTLSQTRK
jgi:hypothetical protein